MEGEWIQSSLADLIDVKHGFAFDGSYITDEPCGDVLLTPGNFAIGGGFKGHKYKYYNGPIPDDFILRQGDLLVTMTDLSKQSDTLGLPAFVPSQSGSRRYLHNQRLGKVLVKDSQMLDIKYLHYLLCSDGYRHEVLSSATGTTVKHTSPERIRRFTFLRPTLPEQRAIAHILGTLDDKIELNRRMNETLEAMARALFKSWFVDFDPVRAKAEGRDPGLPKHLAVLFPDRFVDSELGEIPEGWDVVTLADLVEQRREQVNPFESPDTLFHHYSIPAFDDGPWPKVESGESIKSQKSRVEPDVVLLSKLNPEIERVWMVDTKTDEKAICSTEFLVLRPRPPLGRAMIYCVVRSEEFRQKIEGLVTGTSKSHQRAQAASLLRLPVLRPSRETMLVFDRSAESVLAKSLECRREAHALAALRDALLPKLISGELRVKDAEKFIGMKA